MVRAAQGQFQFVNSYTHFPTGHDLAASTPLLDHPAGIAAFKAGGSGELHTHVIFDPLAAVADDDGLPSVAVAAGAHIFVYRNLRPYFKMVLPSLPLSTVESDIWASGKNAEDIQSRLKRAQADGESLSATAIEVAAAASLAAHEDTISKARQRAPVRYSACTCIAAVYVEHEEPGSQQQLLAGTEGKSLVLFKRHGAEAEISVQLDAVPSMIAVAGALVTGWRAAIALRSGQVCTVRDGKLLPRTLQFDTAIVGIGWVHPAIGSGDREKHLAVATIDGQVRAYSAEGKLRWRVNLHPARITSATNFSQLASTSIDSSGMLIGTATGDMFTIVQGKIVSRMKLGASSTDAVTGIAFGDYAREGNAAIITTSSGALHILVLKRRAAGILKAVSKTAGKRADMLGADTAPPLPVPRKSALFVRAAEREQEMPREMHDIFQRDILRLKLTAARSYVRIAASGLGPTAVLGQQEQATNIRLSTAVEGIEKQFAIKATLHATGHKPLHHLVLVAKPSHPSVFVSPAVASIPLLLPGAPLDMRVQVFVHEKPSQDPSTVIDDLQVTLCLLHSMDHSSQWAQHREQAAAAAMAQHGVPLVDRPLLSAIQRLPVS